MTMQSWLDRYGYSVEFNRRGFRFETSKGEVSNVFVIEDGVKAIRHITLNDVQVWVQKQIKADNPMFNRQAKDDFNAIEV